MSANSSTTYENYVHIIHLITLSHFWFKVIGICIPKHLECTSECLKWNIYLLYTGELGYDGLNGTKKIGPSYAKSVEYIWRILDMHRTGTKHVVCHIQVYLYSLSDPSLADHFFLFFVTKSLCLTSKLGTHLRSTKLCIHVYRQNFLSQLCKMLILHIRSHCKTCEIAHVYILGNGKFSHILPPLDYELSSVCLTRFTMAEALTFEVLLFTGCNFKSRSMWRSMASLHDRCWALSPALR